MAVEQPVQPAETVVVEEVAAHSPRETCSVASGGSWRSTATKRTSFTPWHLRDKLTNGVQQARGMMQRNRLDAHAAWSKNWQALTEGKDVEVIDDDMLVLCERWRRSAQGERHDLKNKVMAFRNGADPRLNRITTAIRSGIPPSVRDPLWYVCSGGASKQRQSPRSFAELTSAGHALKGTDSVHVLEMDIPRSGLDEDRQAVLLEILYAWVAKNPEIGYCQSMNFVAAALLSQLPAERAFWTFCSLVEDLLPHGYYTVSLTGLRIDLKVLDLLVSQYFPRLHKHLVSINLDLMPITMNWFLCLFVNTLPPAVSCRVLDCLLHEGSKVLFRAALTLLRLRETELLQASSVMDAYALLRAPFGSDGLGLNVDIVNLAPASNGQDLLKGMYGQWIRGLSNDTLLQHRAEQGLIVQAEDDKLKSRKEERTDGKPAEEAFAERAKSVMEESSAQQIPSSFFLASALREVPTKDDTEVLNWISFVQEPGGEDDGCQSVIPYPLAMP
mmetsp:Transcript_61211/g.138408  ORF Transcript_61211/g.138408 Transcript_61211/m.138408 type:complete len:500 (-) Transcript_61211:78-1577(-)